MSSEKSQQHTSSHSSSAKKARLQASVSLEEMFNDFDQNGDGTISADEIKQIVGEQLTSDEIDQLIWAVHKNKDGKVNFKEFIQILTL